VYVQNPNVCHSSKLYIQYTSRKRKILASEQGGCRKASRGCNNGALIVNTSITACKKRGGDIFLLNGWTIRKHSIHCPFMASTGSRALKF
jgi:hypothetical protein